MSAAIDPALLAKLVCPATRTPLRWDAERHELVSEAAGLAFPVRDRVPVLVVREARDIGGMSPDDENRPQHVS